MISRNSSRFHRFHNRGFALVVTLLLMVLIAMVAVGMLALSSVELRKSSRETSGKNAESNARLALALAIGGLQRSAGPDQRVTAKAEIEGNQTNRRWVGVWRSTRKVANGEAPLIRWDERELVMIDARTADRLESKDFFETWLVSGGDTRTPGSAGTEMANMVGPGSVKSKDDEVSAPLVRISDSAGNEGAYAYWVSDEAMKASVNSPTLNPAKSGPTLQAARYGIGALDQLAPFDSATDAHLAKVTDFHQASLATATSPGAWTGHFHAVGSRATAVLSDPARGGLKQDLSAYFEKGNIPSKGGLLTAMSDTTPMLSGSRRRNQGPKMGSLRSYAALAGQAGGTGIKPVSAKSLTSQDKFSSLPKMSQFTDQPIHPVLAVAEIYTRFAYVRGYLTAHLYPRIVLWNPYNAKLAASTYTVDFNQSINDSIVVEKRQQSTVDVVSTAYDTRSAKDNRMSFTIESTGFEAGEALVFSPKPTGAAIAGRAMPLALRSSGSNILSASVDPRLLTNFYLAITLLSDKDVTAADLPLFANHNRGAYYWVDMMDWWEGNPDNGLKVSLHLGDAANHASRMKLPMLQLVDTDNWRRGYEGRYNNGRWRVGGVEPIEDFERTPDLEPWARGCYGFRYKWWAEKNPMNTSGTASQRFWQAAVTSDYNLRAAFCHRSPFDAGTDNGEQHHWYIWGPFAVESQQGLPALSPERAAHRSTNGYRANPFFGGANSRPDHVYPLFDIPKSGERIVSIGRFQHTQLTPFLWHPTYAIGGSWVPQNQKTREKSGDPSSQITAAWTDQLPYLPLWMKQDRSRDEVMYDLSYESNQELWDRYFLSGSNEVEKQGFARDSTANPLANARLVPASGNTDSARLADFHQAGSQLLLGGAFNVNSTEPEAWRALFASMKSSALASGGAAFPRFIEPAAAKHEPKDIHDPLIWSGFRSLDDTQITALAEAVVAEVKTRGPFLSVADFVNRRLVTATAAKAETGLAGTLQRAIDRSGVNAPFKSGDLAQSTTGFGTGSYEVGSNSSDWAPAAHLRESKGAGLPTYLQQGDLLQSLGSFLVVRGDTFIVRAYGEARSADGKTVEARAWCEAEVQRMPSYINTADPPEQPAFSATGAPNAAISAASQRYGRRFSVISFRWLSPSEV